MGLLGELIIRNDGAVYTPVVSREMNGAIFILNILTIYGSTSPTMDVTVEHRNVNEDSWSSAGTFTTISTTGEKRQTVTGLKELVRLKLEVVSGSTNSFIRFLILPTQWT